MNSSDSHHQHPNTAEGRASLDALPAIAWCKLPDGSNEFVNQRWQDYTGIPQDEAREQGWQAAVHPDDLPKLTEKWAGIVASGKGGELGVFAVGDVRPGSVKRVGGAIGDGAAVVAQLHAVLANHAKALRADGICSYDIEN